MVCLTLTLDQLMVIKILIFMTTKFCWWVVARVGQGHDWVGWKSFFFFFIATKFYSTNHIHHDFQAASWLKQHIRLVNETMLFHSHLKCFICGLKYSNYVYEEWPPLYVHLMEQNSWTGRTQTLRVEALSHVDAGTLCGTDLFEVSSLSVTECYSFDT